MIQVIVFTIFLVSLLGTIFILYRKIPALTQLPKDGHHGIAKPEFVKDIEKKLKSKHFYLFKKRMLLHKLLSKSKVWILRVEAKVDRSLHGIRKNAQELDEQGKK